MAKIQTLGLFDPGKDKPSGEPAQSEQKAAAPEATSATPQAEEQSPSPPTTEAEKLNTTPTSAQSAPAENPDVSGADEAAGHALEDTPLEPVATPKSATIPEWDALVDAMTPDGPAPRQQWNPTPWVAPKPSAEETPDWDAIGDAIDSLGASPPPDADSAEFRAASGRVANLPQISGAEAVAAELDETPILAEIEAETHPPPIAPSGGRSGWGWVGYGILVLLSIAAGVTGGLVFVHSSDLPQIRQLMDYRPDVMTELYADDGTPVSSFALEHRIIVTYDQIPKVLKDAVLSTEDRHFESHWGVDVVRVAGAAIRNLTSWRWAQGASTLTMQLSKVLFLTPERKFKRKFQEVLIAIQIERHFTKPQIFTMYANQVDLGHGNFGFAAAAQFYFGKRLDQLTLPEAAMLAGLPQTPTGNSPLINPDRARQRRNQVLALMLDNQKITEAEYREARSAPLKLNIQRWTKGVAPYFIEDARQFLETKYGPETVHEKGLRVYTTIDVYQQELAENALRNGLHAYDKRHGWRGPATNIVKDPPTLPNGLIATLETYSHPDWRKMFLPGILMHGVVMEVKPDHAIVRFAEQTARVVPADVAWTGKKIDQVFEPGDVDLFRFKELKGDSMLVTLDQRPQVQGAMVVIENSTGAIRAMVGGYDFEESKFNRARQALRQAGSSFKPYVYAVALTEGARPFDTIDDEPVSFSTSSGPWAPRNYDGKFLGNITLLYALAESRNIPAVKLIDRVGPNKVIAMCRKFGLTARLAPVLPLALGASDVTLLEHTSAFSTFPNDGVHISPRMIARVTNYDGQVVDEFPPDVTDVITAPIARLETSMLREVFMTGTATRAKPMADKFPMGGKTGTASDYTDAAFIGFTPSITVGVWVGFDDRRSLGVREDGARAALPIYMEFMQEWLKDKAVEDFPHSPRLTKPEQVEEILASAGADRILAQGAGEAPQAAAPAAAAAQVSPAPGAKSGTPTAPAAPATGPASAPPKAPASAPAAKEPAAPPAKPASEPAKPTAAAPPR